MKSHIKIEIPYIIRAFHINTMKRLSIILISTLLVASAKAENLNFLFRMYQTDPNIADAVQADLISGGDDAMQAFAIMPDLVTKGRAKLEFELKKQTLDKQKSNVSSGDKQRKNPDGSVRNMGLNIEFQATLAPGRIDCFLSSDCVLEEKDGLTSPNVNTAFVAKSGIPVLLGRWQEGDISRLLVVVIESEKPTEPLSPPGRMIYVDTSVYQTEADAKASRNPVSRTVFPTKSGHSSASGVSHSLFVKFEEKEKKERNWSEQSYSDPSIEVETLLADDASSVFLRYHCNNTKVTGGKRKGLGIPELTYRNADLSAKFAIGVPHTFELFVDKKINPDAKEQDWKFTINCLLYEVK